MTYIVSCPMPNATSHACPTFSLAAIPRPRPMSHLCTLHCTLRPARQNETILRATDATGATAAGRRRRLVAGWTSVQDGDDTIGTNSAGTRQKKKSRTRRHAALHMHSKIHSLRSLVAEQALPACASHLVLRPCTSPSLISSRLTLLLPPCPPNHHTPLSPKRNPPILFAHRRCFFPGLTLSDCLVCPGTHAHTPLLIFLPSTFFHPSLRPSVPPYHLSPAAGTPRQTPRSRPACRTSSNGPQGHPKSPKGPKSRRRGLKVGRESWLIFLAR